MGLKSPKGARRKRVYTDDQPVLAAHARTPGGFIDIVMFTMATMNQRFYNVETIMTDIRTQGLDACKWLMQSQKRGVAYTIRHAEQYVERLPHLDDIAALRFLIEIPHVGIAKAGFIRQMTNGTTGCLDTHNLALLGLSKRAFATPTSTAALTQRLHVYLEACARLGTCAQLWDGWCRVVASKYPGKFQSAEHVSKYHVTCILGNA
jgi:hypothetical protein